MEDYQLYPGQKLRGGPGSGEEGETIVVRHVQDQAEGRFLQQGRGNGFTCWRHYYSPVEEARQVAAKTVETTWGASPGVVCFSQSEWDEWKSRDWDTDWGSEPFNHRIHVSALQWRACFDREGLSNPEEGGAVLTVQLQGRVAYIMRPEEAVVGESFEFRSGKALVFYNEALASIAPAEFEQHLAHAASLPKPTPETRSLRTAVGCKRQQALNLEFGAALGDLKLRCALAVDRYDQAKAAAYSFEGSEFEDGLSSLRELLHE